MSIKFQIIQLLMPCLLLISTARAATLYVSTNSTSATPRYVDWEHAATNIQDAVGIATNGETVLVTNGVYYFSTSTTFIASDWDADGSTGGIRTNYSLVCITNRLTVQSVNGPSRTIIDGYQRGTSNFVANGIANGVLLAYTSNISGFTIRNCSTTNGAERWVVRGGGGIRAHNNGGTISNCVITGCSASHGGGMFFAKGTVVSVRNCVISNNMLGAGSDGGGGIQAYSCGASAGMIRDSVICCNTSPAGAGGITLSYSDGVIISNCVVRQNYNAIMARGGGSVVNCQIVSNTGSWGYYAYVDGTYFIISSSIISYNTGVGVKIAPSADKITTSIVRNCLINGNASNGVSINVATNYGNIIDGCTIVKNVSGGIYAIGRTNPVSVLNCIIYSNSVADIILAGTAPNTATNTIFYNSCATNNLPAAQGNITNNPQFLDFAAGNYRLKASSPCVNTGTNQSWMTNAVDLEGKMRIRYGRVDMGAYELIYKGTLFSGY